MSKQSEYQLTVAVANYLAHRKDLLWTHFPAGEHRNAVTGAKLKRMGLKRGVPDFLIFNPTVFYNPIYSGMGIELKVGTNKLTKEQEAWAFDFLYVRWIHAVCRSVDEVVIQIERAYGK